MALVMAAAEVRRLEVVVRRLAIAEYYELLPIYIYISLSCTELLNAVQADASRSL